MDEKETLQYEIAQLNQMIAVSNDDRMIAVFHEEIDRREKRLSELGGV